MNTGDFAAALGYGIADDHAHASAWSVLASWQQALLIVLGVGVVFSALSVVYVQHIHRQQLRQIHYHIGWQDKLDHQWVQLLVEKSALASLERVETVAREDLGMVKPDLSQVTYLEVEQYSDPWRVVENNQNGRNGEFVSHVAYPQRHAPSSAAARSSTLVRRSDAPES